MNKKGIWKKLILLTVILTIVSISFEDSFLDTINLIQETSLTKSKNNKDNIPVDASTIDESNRYFGSGAAINSTEYAQGINSSIYIAPFENNSYGFASVNTPPLWNSYSLFSSIDSLSDNVTWQTNGNLNGPSNWSYIEVDNENLGLNGSDNDENCWGYYAGPGVTPAGSDTGALFVRNGYIYPPNDAINSNEYAMFNQTISVNRGEISGVRFSCYIYTQSSNNGVSKFAININGYVKQFPEFETGAIHNQWILKEFTIPSPDLDIYFSTPGDISIKVGIDVITDATLVGGYMWQTCYMDNITLWLRSEALPSQIDLKMNNTVVTDGAFGKGNVSIASSFSNLSPGEFKPTFVNFTSNSSGVTLITSLTNNVNRSKSSQNGVGATGTDFFVVNNTRSNVTAYYYAYTPSNFFNYNFSLRFPTDWDVWAVYNPLPNEVLGQLTENSGEIKVLTENANDYPGLWRFEFSSPNYLLNLSLYTNLTSNPTNADWITTAEIFAGNLINVTVYIDHGLVTDLTQTKAMLIIKYPNGTIWDEKTQIKVVESSGYVPFNSFLIPESNPGYDVGTYKVFVVWNNSMGNYGINETGMQVKSLTVRHLSKLVPDQYYYPDLMEGSVINLKVNFNDALNFDAIQDANVYFSNLTGQTQYMSEISPGYYFSELKIPYSMKGNYSIQIFANHTFYQAVSSNISLEIGLETTFFSPNSSAISAIWNENVTLTLNLTETYSKTPINNANLSYSWKGDSFYEEIAGGIYRVQLNTSFYAPLNQYVLTVTHSDNWYEINLLQFTITIGNRQTELNLYLNQLNQTDTRAITVTLEENVNISISYMDKIHQNQILTATINLTGSIFSSFLLEFQNGIYQTQLNSSNLGVGLHALTINGLKQNHTQQAILFTINVNKRESGLDLFLDQQNKTQSNFLSVKLGNDINVSVNYFDLLKQILISNAVINISTTGFAPMQLIHLNNWYQYNLSSTTLGIGTFSFVLIAISPNNTQQSFSFTISIERRDAKLDIFLDQQNKTQNSFLSVQLGNVINVSVNYYDVVNQLIIQNATINISTSGFAPMQLILLNNWYQYNLSSTTLGIGSFSFSLIAISSNNTQQTFTFTITIERRDAEFNLFLDTNNATLSRYINVQLGSVVNVSVNYFDSIAKYTLYPAIINITGLSQSPIQMIYLNNMYQNNLSTYQLGIGSYSLTIIMISDNNTQISISFTISIERRTAEIDLFLNNNNSTITRSINVQLGDVVNLSINYFDAMNLMLISPASVNLTGLPSSPIQLIQLNNWYQWNITTRELSVGSYSCIVYASSANHTIESIFFSLVITQRNTGIALILNGTNSTVTKFIATSLGNTINVSISYYDLIEGFISSADVNLTIQTAHYTLSELNGIYQINLFTFPCGIGTFSVTITASSANYTFQVIQFTLTVNQRASGTDLFLNQQNRTLIKSMDVILSQKVNVSLSYFDLETGWNINSAAVILNGQSIMVNMTYLNGVYQYELNVTYLAAIKSYIFTVAITSQNYTSQSIQFIINVIARYSSLDLFLGNQNASITKFISVPAGYIVNISVGYYDLENGLITGAEVNITGMFTSLLPLQNNWYQIQFDTNPYSSGSYVCILTASFANNTRQIIQFTISINQRESGLNLFLSGNNATSTRFISVQLGTNLNISVRYFDLNGLIIQSATISMGVLSNNVVLSLSYNIYQTLLNTQNLGVGTFSVTITAQSINYSGNSIVFTLVITPIPAGINVYLQQENQTISRMVIVPLRTLINISLDYYRLETYSTITSATVTLNGLKSGTVTMGFQNNFYTLILNASELGLGDHFLSILAYKDGYAQTSILITITITQIPTNISLASGLNVVQTEPGKKFIVEIILEDLITHELIRGANVTYTWEFGTGTLVDPDGDGHYTMETLIRNPGTYTIYITVYKGIEYKFDQYQVIVSVISPEGVDVTWIIVTLVSSIALIIISFVLYNFYFKYPKMVRSIRSMRRNLGRDKLTQLKVKDADIIVGEQYDSLTKSVRKSIPRDEKAHFARGDFKKTNNSTSATPTPESIPEEIPTEQFNPDVDNKEEGDTGVTNSTSKK